MIAGLRPYPLMRDSGLPWLGEVPTFWNGMRLKRILRPIDHRSSTGCETLLSLRRDHGVVVYADHFSRPPQGATTVGFKLVRVGDLVVNRLQANNGLVFHSRLNGLVSPDYSVFEPRVPIRMEYISELLRTTVYKAHFRRESTGLGTGSAGFLRLYDDTFLGTVVALPSLPEQSLILRFLDHADRRIRRYIRAKQKLIKLLEEQKQAIIHRAVTRGLDPNVRLKPSGVEWLGDVPEHWEVVRFKRRIGFQEGPGIMAADFRDEGVPLLRISCLRGETASLEGCNFLDPQMVQRRWSQFAVREGNYLLSASASTGNVVLATEVVAGAIPYTGILRLWALSENAFMPFVRLYMGCPPFQEQIDAAKSGVAIEHFGPTHLKRMFIALPPPKEQRAIVELVAEQTAPCLDTIERARRGLFLLREYRTRLVADVVTGKLDVRAAGGRLPEEVEEPEPLDEADALADGSRADTSDDLDNVPEETEA